MKAITHNTQAQMDHLSNNQRQISYFWDNKAQMKCRAMIPRAANPDMVCTESEIFSVALIHKKYVAEASVARAIPKTGIIQLSKTFLIRCPQIAVVYRIRARTNNHSRRIFLLLFLVLRNFYLLFDINQMNFGCQSL